MKSTVPIFALLVGLSVMTCGSIHGQSAANDPAELVSVRANYLQKLKAATDPIKKQYADYLENLKKSYGAKGNVDAALAVQNELDGLAIPGLQLPGTKDAKIIIWNQNNGGKGDRGTRKVNVILSGGGRVLWRKNGIRLQWDPNKPTKEEVAVPSVGADMVRIEITELVNDRGGLSEIEYLKNGQNLALGGNVVVSGFWEGNPKNAGGMLNDGVRETFWLLADKQEGWAEITLKQGQ